MIFFFWLTDN